MGQVLHGTATTTEAVRRAIQNSEKSLRVLAKRHGINQKTVPKWKTRTLVADLPTGPNDAKSTVLSLDDEKIRCIAVSRQFCKDAIEYAEPAPADEPVADRFRRPVCSRRVPPMQAVADHEKDAAHHPPIITRAIPCDKGNTARSGASAPRTATTSHPSRHLLPP